MICKSNKLLLFNIAVHTFLTFICFHCLSPPGGSVLWWFIYKEGWGGSEEREPSCGGGNSWTHSSSVSQQESQPAPHQALHPGRMRQDAGAAWWADRLWDYGCVQNEIILNSVQYTHTFLFKSCRWNNRHYSTVPLLSHDLCFMKQKIILCILIQFLIKTCKHCTVFCAHYPYWHYVLYFQNSMSSMLFQTQLW